MGLLAACGGPTSNLGGAGGGDPWSPTAQALSSPTSTPAEASPALSSPISAPPEVSPAVTTHAAQAATPDATIMNLTDQIDQELKDMENSNEDLTLQPLLPVQ